METRVTVRRATRPCPSHDARLTGGDPDVRKRRTRPVRLPAFFTLITTAMETPPRADQMQLLTSLNAPSREATPGDRHRAESHSRRPAGPCQGLQRLAVPGRSKSKSRLQTKFQMTRWADPSGRRRSQAAQAGPEGAGLTDDPLPPRPVDKRVWRSEKTLSCKRTGERPESEGRRNRRRGRAGSAPRGAGGAELVPRGTRTPRTDPSCARPSGDL